MSAGARSGAYCKARLCNEDGNDNISLMCVCTDKLFIPCMDESGIIAEIMASLSKDFRLKI